MGRGLVGLQIHIDALLARESKSHNGLKSLWVQLRMRIQEIARSIRAFGFNVPVLIDPEGRVIAGRGRILACQELGWREVPTIRLEHLTEAQAQAFMIADNRLTENAEWDNRLLGQQLKDLAAVNLD